jgi:hypothetical protein
VESPEFWALWPKLRFQNDFHLRYLPQTPVNHLHHVGQVLGAFISASHNPNPPSGPPTLPSKEGWTNSSPCHCSTKVGTQRHTEHKTLDLRAEVSHTFPQQSQTPPPLWSPAHGSPLKKPNVNMTLASLEYRLKSLVKFHKIKAPKFHPIEMVWMVFEMWPGLLKSPRTTA